MIDNLLLAAEGGGQDFAAFAQYGAVGAIAFLGILFARNAYKREADRADRAYKQESDRADRMEAENRRLNDLILERVIPAMTAATSAAQDSAQLLATMQRDREIERLTMGHQRRMERGDT